MSSLYRKSVVFLIVALLISMTVFAQTIKGRIKDSAGKAVPFASINLKNGENHRIIGYAVSDISGAYTLQLPADIPAGGLEIEITSVGYKVQRRPLTDTHLPYDFIMEVSANQLREVEIKNSRPSLRTHGDTIGYKVSEFAGAQDRTIGDVLKKMPGITISSNGTISYNNKAISNLYINGDNLLDDKYNIATSTIPQSAVDQVQVLQNDQPIKLLRNKVMSDDVALNLTIKPGAKVQMIGQESIGAGLPKKYDIDLNAMMFKDKYKGINYLKANNTGIDLQQELVAHNASNYEQLIDNSLPAALLSLGTVNNPALSRSRYLFNQASLLNFNNLLKLTDNTQLRINAWYLHDKQQQDYSQESTIFLPNDTVHYSETQHNHFRPDNLHAQLTLNINRNKFYLNNAFTIDANKSAYDTELATAGASLKQALHDNLTSFSNEFNFIKSIRSNKIIQAYSYVTHSSEPESRTIGPNYKPELFNKNNQYDQLMQTVNVPTWYSTNYIGLKIPGNLITQSFKTGFSVQSQNLSSALSTVQLNNQSTPQSDSSTNHLNWTRTKLYAEADYDLPGTILQANLSLPLGLQQISYADNQYKMNKQLTRWYFNPQFRLRYRVGVENYIFMSYNYHNKTASIEDIYQGHILKDYLTLYANSADLAEMRAQQASAGFSYRKSLILLFASFNLMYDHLASNKIASAIITNNLQQQVMLPYPNATNTWTISSSISKYFFVLKTTLSAGLQWQSAQTMQLQNDQLLPFNTTATTYTLGTDTKINKEIGLNYKASFIQISSHSDAYASTRHINQLQQQVSVEYNPLSSLQCRLSGEHYFTHQDGNKDLKYFFADASMKYNVKKWKVNLEFSAVNFLNVKNYSALYLSANTFTSSSYTLPGRIILCKLLFNL
ncbi:MAG: hypothetical protein QM726_08455 [Chitinophagaceae bacterium]